MTFDLITSFRCENRASVKLRRHPGCYPVGGKTINELLRNVLKILWSVLKLPHRNICVGAPPYLRVVSNFVLSLSLPLSLSLSLCMGELCEKDIKGNFNRLYVHITIPAIYSVG